MTAHHAGFTQKHADYPNIGQIFFASICRVLPSNHGNVTAREDLCLACRNGERAADPADSAEEADARLKEDDMLPDPSTFLENYPRCKRLVDTFRANPNTHNKTPLAVLHEYATRLSLEVSQAIATFIYFQATDLVPVILRALRIQKLWTYSSQQLSNPYHHMS